MSKTPFVGAIVHFYNENIGTPAGSAPPGYNGVGAGPYSAVVTQVFKDQDGRVIYSNMKVLPPFGKTFDEGSVSEFLGAPGVDSPPRYWVWPPETGQ